MSKSSNLWHKMERFKNRHRIYNKIKIKIKTKIKKKSHR